MTKNTALVTLAKYTPWPNAKTYFGQTPFYLFVCNFKKSWWQPKWANLHRAVSSSQYIMEQRISVLYKDNFIEGSTERVTDEKPETKKCYFKDFAFMVN